MNAITPQFGDKLEGDADAQFNMGVAYAARSGGVFAGGCAATTASCVLRAGPRIPATSPPCMRGCLSATCGGSTRLPPECGR